MKTLAQVIMMDPGLNFNNLKYFYDAVEAQSISEAARRNFVTQSAVSQGIAKLEKALGVSLITHQRNCFKLTSEGEEIFILAQHVFRTVKEMIDVSQKHVETVSGTVNVVCTQSIAVNILSTVFQKLKTDYPQVSVNMKIGKMENVSLMLKRGLMDVGIVVESEICDQFDKQVIRKGNFSIYAKKGISQTILQGVYVDHANGLFVDRLHKNYRKSYKQDMTISQELDSWQVLAKCAENGIGHCFLPDFIVAGNPLISACELITPIPYRIVAIYPKGVHLNRATKAFLNYLTF